MRNLKLLIPDLPKTSEVSRYLQEIDTNRWYTNFGILNDRFEKRLIESKIVFGADSRVPYVTTVVNCTLAIQLLLQSLKLKEHSRILLPAFTFPATALAVINSNFEPVFCSVESENWLLTPRMADYLLSQFHFDAVIPVSTFGHPVSAIEWSTFAIRNNMHVVVDAACAIGAQAVAQNVHAAFSFHATKPFGIGEGGLCASTDKSVIERVKSLSNFGFDGDLVASLGTNAKLSEYHAAVGLAQLDRWEKIKAQKIDMAFSLRERLKPLGLKLQTLHKRQIPSVFPFLLRDNYSLASVNDYLNSEGVETRRWYCPPLHFHPALNYIESHFNECPHEMNINDFNHRLLGVPFHHMITDADIERIYTTIAKCLMEPKNKTIEK